jgi:hypothetical protein
MRRAAGGNRWFGKRQAFFVGGLLLITGCAGLTGNRTPPPPPQAALLDTTPTPAELVKYLNDNAAKVTALESRHLGVDVQADRSIGLVGSLYCQAPKNFRMRAKLIGQEQADFGSNNQEFWFWIAKGDPPHLFHCSYAELDRGGARMPFPLQPEWVMEALGMGQHDPNGRYEPVQKRDRYLDLIEHTTSPQGQPMTKVTRLNNFNATGTTPQVVGHYLREDRNPDQIVCQAIVLSVQTDPQTRLVVPHKIELKWPAQKMAMTLTLGEISVNRPRTDSPSLFVRPPATRDMQTFDLARGMLDSGPTSIQRAGASR